MVHICSRHSGNMAGAEAERSEVEAEPQRSAAERSGAKAPALRGLFKFARVSAAERHFPRSGLGRSFSRGAASPAGRGYGLGVRGALAPAVRYGYIAVFVPDTGID